MGYKAMAVTAPQLQRVPPPFNRTPGQIAFERNSYRQMLMAMPWREFKFEHIYANGHILCGVWREVYEERTLLRPSHPIHDDRTGLLRAAEGVSPSNGTELLRMADILS